MNKKLRALLWVAFGCYCLFLLYVLLLGRTASGHHVHSLIPLASTRAFLRSLGSGAKAVWTALYNLVGNLAIFLPMGMFLPLLFRSQDRWWKVFLTTFAAVFFAEGMQWTFSLGCFDVDDFLLNLSGCMIGYALLKLPPLRRRVTK